MVVTSIILILSAYILLRQLKAIFKSNSLDGFKDISDKINNRKSRELRQEVFNLYEDHANLEKCNDVKKKEIDDHIVLFDQLGCLINKKLIDENVALEIYWDVIIKFWDSVEDWIVQQRKYKKVNQDTSINNFNKSFFLKTITIFKNVFLIFGKLKLQILKLVFLLDPTFKFYPNKKPKAFDYGETHYENFQLLVWRAERFCFKKRVNRPNIKIKQKNSADFSYCETCGSMLIKNLDNDKKLRYYCQSCNRIVYRNSKPSVGALILNDRNNILLTKRNKEPFKNYWDIPGGFLEFGEDPEDGLKRELKEELNLAISNISLCKVFIEEYNGKNDYVLNLFYECRANTKAKNISDEISKFKWFSLKNLPDDIAFKKSAEVLRNYAQNKA